jgi:hypothetical protein
MKNRINTGQFRVKTGSCGNGRKNPSPISVNTEMGPRKYGNKRTKVENGMGQNRKFSVRFQRYLGSNKVMEDFVPLRKKCASCSSFTYFVLTLVFGMFISKLLSSP